MAKTYDDLYAIPLPSFAHTNKANNTVYVILPSRNKRGDFNRRNIGRLASKDTMYVNDNFRRFYPELWNQYFGNKSNTKSDFLHLGLYLATLASVYQNQLYECLKGSFNPKIANTLIDYAMYSILTKSDSTMSIKEVLEEQAVFSLHTFSDSWYSELFSEITKDKRKEFLNNWILKRKNDGLDKVWICVDGSNNVCNSKESSLATKGNSKTHTNNNIVSYMYAVDGNDGTPIMYDVYHGSIIDKTAFEGIINYFKEREIKIEGFILDRGFCSINNLNVINECGYKYVMMTTSNTLAHKTLMEKYATEIRWKMPYIIDKKGIFATKDKIKVFDNSDIETNGYLFYHGGNGTERSLSLIAKIIDEYERIQSLINKKQSFEIEPTLKKYFNVVKENDNNINVVYNYEIWQNEIDNKGYSSIISSEDITPKEIDQLYNLRDVSEKVFSEIKSQLGFDVFRVQEDEAILNKMLVCFIATIIRQKFVNVSLANKISTNVMLAELNKVHMVLDFSSKYALSKKEPIKVTNFLKELGFDSSLIDLVIVDYNEREKYHSHERKLPISNNVKKKAGRPKKPKKELEIKPTRGRGRPKGSKNKKTLEKENKTKRPVGRPRKDDRTDH